MSVEQGSLVSSSPTLADLRLALRTRQWAKNALLFAGIIFAGHLRTASTELKSEVARVVLAFVCFCALSSATYLINDWSDIERDRQHPVKRNRPLASGRMSVPTAAALVGVCSAIAVLCAAAIMGLAPEARFFPVAAFCYFALTISYSLVLKHQVIIDIIALAGGFVIRVVAGCVAIPVAISPWIIFCTFTLALFIASCKRRAELLEMGTACAGTRSVLPLYTLELLNVLVAVAAGLTITAYSLYTFNATNSKALSPALKGSPLLMTTIPFVVYGVFRFLYLAYATPVGGEPESMLRDKPMMINAAIWAALVAVLTLVDYAG